MVRTARYIPNKTAIWIGQYLDKNTWRNVNNEFHMSERAAYMQLEVIRKTADSVFTRYRVRKFIEVE